MNVLLAVILSAAVATPRPMIWEPSGGAHFRAGAPRATTGWLGLYCRPSCSLRPAVLEYVADKRFDDVLYVETRPVGAAYVFRDVPGLTEGPITRIELTTPLERRQALPLVYSLHPLQLFLSSAAREGELLREVANFERSSC